MAPPTASVRQVADVPASPEPAAPVGRENPVFGQSYFLHLVGPPSLTLFAASAAAAAAPALRPHLAMFCHQIEARTFCPDGRPMGLCARCTGIYLGVAAAWIGIGWLKRNPAILRVLEPACYALAALSLPLYLAGIEAANWPRFGLGLSFGSAAAFALWRARQFVLWRRNPGAEATT